MSRFITYQSFVISCWKLLPAIGAVLLISTLAAGPVSARTPKNTRARAGKSSNSTPIILGSGRHRYEWGSGWAKLPEGMSLGNMHGAVQVDSKGLIYLSAESENAVMVFDQDGNFVRAFGKEWKADKPGNGIHGMQLRKENGKEYLYLTHLDRHEFAKITLTGEIVWVRGYP